MNNMLDCKEAAQRFNTTNVNVWRWAMRGINGVMLEHLRIGRKLYFTPEQIEKFGIELAHSYREKLAEKNAVVPDAPRRSNVKQREQQVAQARAFLQGEGVL